MVRIDIDDQDIIEPALLRLLPGMREQYVADRLDVSTTPARVDLYATLP